MSHFSLGEYTQAGYLARVNSEHGADVGFIDTQFSKDSLNSYITLASFTSYTGGVIRQGIQNGQWNETDTAVVIGYRVYTKNQISRAVTLHSTFVMPASDAEDF